jgi:hypothetical protein
MATEEMGAARQGRGWAGGLRGLGMRLAPPGGGPTGWVWGGGVVAGVGWEVERARVVGGHVKAPLARSPPGSAGADRKKLQDWKSVRPRLRVVGLTGPRADRAQQQPVRKSVRPSRTDGRSPKTGGCCARPAAQRLGRTDFQNPDLLRLLRRLASPQAVRPLVVVAGAGRNTSVFSRTRARHCPSPRVVRVVTGGETRPGKPGRP